MKEKKIRKKKLAIVIVISVLIVVVLVGLIVRQWRIHDEAIKSIDHLALARAASGNSNFTEAEKEYKILLNNSENDDVVWREYGYVLQQEKKKDEAAVAYERALAIKKDDATTENFLGNLYRDLIQYDKAETAYRTAIELSPNLLPAIVNLGHLYILEGKPDQAISLLSAAYDGTRQRSEIGLQLASVYKNNGKTAEAKATVVKVLKADPENVQALALEKAL